MLSNSAHFRQSFDGKLFTVPCCRSNIATQVTDASDLTAIMNSNADKVASSYHTHCQTCIDEEAHQYQSSMREVAHRFIPSDAVDGDVYILGVQIDTKCNAECITCGPNFSSLWQKRHGLPVVNQVDNHYNTIINKIDFTHITHIRFFGGEPFLTSQNNQLLALVPNPANVTLLYSTNGSIFPSPEVTRYWENFKEVIVTFSIDDIEDRFEYIRRPLKWDKVQQNFINISKLLPNIKIKIRCTVNVLSLWYTPMMDHWLNEVQDKEKLVIPIQWSPALPLDSLHSIYYTPLSLRESVKSRLPAEHALNKLIDSIGEKVLVSDQLFSNFENLDQDYNLSYKDSFLEALLYF